MNPSRVPSYRLHRPTGLAVVTLGGKDQYLGKHGTPQSQAEYRRVVGEWLASGAVARGPEVERGLIVDDLIQGYRKHAARHYTKHGRPTSEVVLIDNAIGFLHDIYGHTEAATFGPLSLKAARDAMVRAKRVIEPKEGVPTEPKREEPRFCRNTINLHVGRIRRLFRWAAENGYVEPSVYHSLLSVQGLQRGRTEALESEPVRPVPDAVVDATLPRVCRQVAAMVLLQRLTGMRPGEVVTMRVGDLDTKSEPWIYRPASHKTEHHGRAREVSLGPKAQEIIRPFLKADFGAFLFSPKEAAAERHALARESRVTPMTPSQRLRRRKSNPKKAPGDRYTTTSYARAISVACEERKAPTGKSKQAARPKISHWHPNQLRHSAATKLRALYGIETARVILGHSSLNTSEIYAEADQEKARAAMANVG